VSELDAIRLLKLFGVLACVLVGGCQKASDVVDVTGTVTWNGQPIPTGMIVLQPMDPQHAPAGCKIADGKFLLRTKPGKVRVQIEAVRTTAQRDPQSGAYLGEMYIPARYNTESELEAIITRDGENRFDFALKN
jgi:hypothetical protein